MDLDLTRQSLLKTVFYFLILTTIFWGVEFFQPTREGLAGLASVPLSDQAPQMGLGTLINDFIAGFPVLGILLSSLLVFVNSFLVTRIIIRNVIFLERTYMPAIVYLLISSGYYNSYMSFLPLSAALLMLIGISSIFRSADVKRLASGHYLASGFAFGVAGILYAPALLFVILLFIGLLQFRLFDLREWVSAIAGWGLPAFFYAYIVWLAGGEFTAIFSEAKEALLTFTPLPSLKLISIFEWVFIGCVGVMLLLSLWAFATRRNSYKAKPKKTYLFFIWMLMVAGAVMTFAPCHSLYQLPLVAIPLAVIIPTYANRRKLNFVAGFTYTLMIGCAVVIHLLPLFL